MTISPITAIVQARMTSTRLPGKVLRDIAGQPMLARVVERTRRAKWLDRVIVATTHLPADDDIADFCERRRYECFRGSLHDVLDRCYKAAKSVNAGIIVRVTADCPLADPGLIDDTVSAFLGFEGGSKIDPGIKKPLPDDFDFPLDFAANRLPPPWKRTYPIGLDIEVCTFASLERAWQEAEMTYHREHVMPYLYELERSRHYRSVEEVKRDMDIPAGFFRVLLLDHDSDYGHLRWTVDTPADLEVVRKIFEYFGGDDTFSWKDVLALYEQSPELRAFNAGVFHKDYRETDYTKDS
jgi:spore coat polysaccharide biosynthesis protein SpsF